MEGLPDPSDQKPSLDDLSLYGQFSVGGYNFSAYMPNFPAQPQEWTVVVRREGQIVRQEYVPMDYEPVFGPDVSDVNRLNARVEDIITELGLEGDS